MLPQKLDDGLYQPLVLPFFCTLNTWAPRISLGEESWSNTFGSREPSGPKESLLDSVHRHEITWREVSVFPWGRAMPCLPVAWSAEPSSKALWALGGPFAFRLQGTSTINNVSCSSFGNNGPQSTFQICRISHLSLTHDISSKPLSESRCFFSLLNK